MNMDHYAYRVTWSAEGHDGLIRQALTLLAVFIGE